MRLFPILVFSSLIFGQSGRTVAPPYHASVAVNFYICQASHVNCAYNGDGGQAATPSDSNAGVTKALPFATLAHALSLLPPILDNNYILNLADGVAAYTEAIDTTGFFGNGMFNSPHSGSIKILGNTTTPANVTFNGTVGCLTDFVAQGYTSTACIAGTARIMLSGIKLTNTSHYGVLCQGGTLQYDNVTVTESGVSTDESVSAAHFNCRIFLTGTNLFNGFNTDISPTRGIGFYNSYGTQVSCQSGTTTITGPGTGSSPTAFGTYGLVLEQGSGAFQMHGGCTLNVNGVLNAIVLNDNTSFDAFDGTETIALSNGSTSPTASQGIVVNAGGVFHAIGEAITIDHYTTCVVANQQNSNAFRSGGSYSGTNCTATAVTNNGQTVGF